MPLCCGRAVRNLSARPAHGEAATSKTQHAGAPPRVPSTRPAREEEKYLTTISRGRAAGHADKHHLQMSFFFPFIHPLAFLLVISLIMFDS